MQLRNFLYLDTDTLNNYLSALEGYAEIEVEETVTQQKKAGGKVSIKAVEGGGEAENTTSRKRKLATTDEARFQRLTELVNEDEEILNLDAFDEGIWNSLQRGEVIEVQAKLEVPPIIQNIEATTAIAPYMDLLRLAGVDITNDQSADTAIKGMSALGNILETRPLPVLFEAISTKGFHFYTGLDRRYLKCGLSHLLEGEVTVFGKIIRFVEKQKSEVVFDVLPEFNAVINANRQQRRRSAKAQKDMTYKLRGPGIILATTAIYR